MAKFGLVYDNKIVVGPRDYRFTPFNAFLIKQNITFDLPKIYESNEMINGGSFTILPVTSTIIPNLGKYDQLAGPTFQISSNSITETYTAIPKNVEAVKNEMIAKVSENRYIKETSDIKLNIQNTDIIIEADRMNKMMIIQITGLMNDTDINNFKFPKSNNWLPMTKTDMMTIVESFIIQTQNAFDWEQNIISQINNSNNFEKLDLIDLGDIVTIGV